MGRRRRSDLTNEHFFFVTTTVVRWAKVFTEDRYCDILIHNLKHYQRRYQFVILGYVIMPTHFHWIVKVDPAFGTISDIMRDIKKYSAWDVLEALQKDGRKELVKVFETEAAAYPGHERKFWMKRFDDEVVRNSEMFRTKLRYIHNNPVEAELVERADEYKYSSARNYTLGNHSVLFVDTTWL